MNANDIILIGKRNHNTKRRYLLINKIQGKHIPTNAIDGLEMMDALGRKLKSKYPNTKLIIGFCETATAIGAEVSTFFENNNARYITTTRENVPSVNNWISFQEEHSHAVDHALNADDLEKYIESTDTIILIDDELSTGKTIRNIVKALKEKYPILNQKKIVAASILNRMSDDNIKETEECGVSCEWLIKMENKNYDPLIDTFNTVDPVTLHNFNEDAVNKVTFITAKDQIPNVRIGVDIAEYKSKVTSTNRDIMKEFDKETLGKKVLVLGTEEYMYPAMNLTKQLNDFMYIDAKTHSTTRSPISILDDDKYPIKNGYKIHSFYEDGRETYIYNVDTYDTVIIVTDSTANVDTITNALNDIATIFKCNKIYLVRQ